MKPTRGADHRQAAHRRSRSAKGGGAPGPSMSAGAGGQQRQHDAAQRLDLTRSGRSTKASPPPRAERPGESPKPSWRFTGVPLARFSKNRSCRRGAAAGGGGRHGPASLVRRSGCSGWWPQVPGRAARQCSTQKAGGGRKSCFPAPRAKIQAEGRGLPRLRVGSAGSLR